MKNFGLSESKKANMSLTVAPAGAVCEAVVYFVVGGVQFGDIFTKSFSSTGVAQTVSVDLMTPSVAGVYDIYVDVFMEGTKIAGHVSTEQVTTSSGSSTPTTYSLVITAKDSVTNLPLQGVSIKVKSQANQVGNFGADPLYDTTLLTGIDGVASFTLPYYQYDVTFSKTGYVSGSFATIAAENKTYSLLMLPNNAQCKLGYMWSDYFNACIPQFNQFSYNGPTVTNGGKSLTVSITTTINNYRTWVAGYYIKTLDGTLVGWRSFQDRIQTGPGLGMTATWNEQNIGWGSPILSRFADGQTGQFIIEMYIMEQASGSDPMWRWATTVNLMVDYWWD